VVAERTFFYHSLSPDGYIPVERALHLFRPLRLIPVEVSNGVRTGGGAITATDAATIHNAHDPFLVCIGGAYRTNLDTGRMLTMHAGSGKKPRFDVRIFALDEGKEFNPVDGAAHSCLLGPDDGNIVLCMASHHAGLTPRAFIQIDHHSPLMHFLLRVSFPPLL
jgi:hypothetical protein